MNLQSINQTISACIKRIEKGETTNRLNDAQKAIAKQQKADLRDCLALAKRVKMYGGIESLLQQASKAQSMDTLFPAEPENG